MSRKPKTTSTSQGRGGKANASASSTAKTLGAPVASAQPGKSSALSIRDVASRAGVSIATVSRVVNNEAHGVSSETRARIQSLIKEMNYLPNRIGRALRVQTSDTYALVISNIQNNLYAAIAWELERQLNDIGKVILLFNTNENATLQDRCFDEINGRRVNGLFMLCAVESRHLRQTVDQNYTVFINRRVDSLDEMSFVGVDDYTAARDIMLAILRNREMPIGIIHGPLYSNTSARRVKGIMDLLRERKVAIDEGDLREASLSMDSGYQCAVELLERKRYRALFCGNDQIAYGAYRRCREMGLAVPDDVRIYGFDDNPLNDWLAPWLNTVRVPHVSFATEAIRQMHKLRDGGPHRSIILPYDIVLRG
ncbi:LacI family DNA-binding transcriptional regulator [Methylocapsa sp. S129]|uniref:LacI family DNA-binding transcriptional regulator n=1 Tax=Methylocapsa sp. S129 TaxID=1641869 RepID=UPI00131D5EEE|nr:LacI family DNA-binding transcriptional regulator [Methylocapsa sp. S129]